MSKQSALSSLSTNKPPNFTFLPPPICSTLWRVAKASPTCPNRTWLQIRFCPHPVLRKDRVKQLILHVNKDRCKGNSQAVPTHLQTEAQQSRAGGGETQPIPCKSTLKSLKLAGTWLVAFHTFLKEILANANHFPS